MRTRIVVNAVTGEVQTVPYTPEEEAQADLDQAADQANQAASAADAKDVTKAGKLLKSIALVIADLHGLTPAQIKNLVQNKYDSLP